MDYLENRTFAEIQVEDSAQLTRTLTIKDIQLFAAVTGDINPAHVDENFAKNDRFHHIVGHGMWSSSLISAVLGTQLPGPGTIYLNQSLKFTYPVAVGDTVKVIVRVMSKNAENKHVTLDCQCINQDGKTVISGIAEVLAPVEKIKCRRTILPEVDLRYADSNFNQFLAQAQKLAALPTAVVHPVTREAIEGAILAAQKKLIIPVFVGPEAKIRKAAMDAKIDISAYEIVATEHSHAAAAEAVAMAHAGTVAMLMKGSLHTDELLHEVVQGTTGLRTSRRLSHVFIIDVPTYPRPILLTDAAINIQPDLDTKCDILQNVIDFAHAIGIAEPKAAILSAVETVNPKMQSTLDAAALCKMADRGQIHGAIVDGPLAFDNAVSEQAALIKEIISPVAGRADILLVPDIEAGNMLAKQLEYLAQAKIAGLVLGARVPIVLTSRADSAEERMMSCVFAVLQVEYQKQLAQVTQC